MNIQKATEIFDELQRRSEDFKYGQVYSGEDLQNEIFKRNKHFINQESEIVFENRFYYSNTFDYLAQQRGCYNDAELFLKTRDEFSKKYKGQFREAMALKDHLIGYLSQSLYPKYFSSVDFLKTHYLRSKYSQYLFSENSDNTIHALCCFYTGNHDRIKRNLSDFMIGEEYFLDTQYTPLREHIETALSRLLSIQDACHKAQVLLQFPKETIYYARPEIESRSEPIWNNNEAEFSNRAGTDKPEDEGVSIDKIINFAIKPLRKNNRKRAKEFMELYAGMRDTYPQYNPTDFVDEIDWVEPTPNTQKDWMEKFDKAEKTLSISN